MEVDAIKLLLQNVKNGDMDVDEALSKLKILPYEDLGFARVDHHRTLRNGYPEVIFAQGKTPEQVRIIFEKLSAHDANIMATRAGREHFEAVHSSVPDAVYHELARMIVLRRTTRLVSDQIISVITAGTADIPVAEEAALTCEILGNKVERVFDVGVAGIHRLLSKTAELKKANVLIVVAGMEGALASVVGGLVDRPVIAVPTSVGYGASFGGLSALLTMLNSCASGVGVVNIDNGFGAGYLASMINRPKDVNE